jgi:hypothetical protein
MSLLLNLLVVSKVNVFFLFFLFFDIVFIVEVHNINKSPFFIHNLILAWKRQFIVHCSVFTLIVIVFTLKVNS